MIYDLIDNNALGIFVFFSFFSFFIFHQQQQTVANNALFLS